MLDDKPFLRVVLIIVSIAMVLAGVFVVGGVFSCSGGGGVYTLQGYRCVDLDVVRACEVDGVYYPLEDYNLFNGSNGGLG